MLLTGNNGIEYSHTEVLFLAWCIADNNKTKPKKEKFIHLDLTLLSPYFFKDIEPVWFLFHFTELGCIKDLRIITRKFDPKKRTSTIAKIKTYSSKEVKEKRKKNMGWMPSYLREKATNIAHEYHLNIDDEKFNKIINNYLIKWKNNSLFFSGENVLIVKKQIEIVASRIFKLLEKHPPQMLMIEWIEEKGLELMTTLLFLESIKCIKIIEYHFYSDDEEIPPPEDEMFCKLCFRINVNDKFFKQFTKESHHYSPQFNIEKLLSIKKPNKEDAIKISLDRKNKKLLIDKQEIKVLPSVHQYDLLESLFKIKPIDEDLSFEEIGEMVDESLDKEKARKRYHQAANTLNTKIELETKIKKLLKTNRHHVRFNPENKIQLS